MLIKKPEMDHTSDLAATKPKRSYRKSELTRQKIFEVGMLLMTERGYQGTTVRDICKTAHVSLGAFYRYFNSKSDLLHDIYAKGDQFFRDEVSRKIQGKKPCDQLCIFAKSYGELNTQTGFEMVRVLYNPENEWFAKKRPMQKVLYEIVADAQREAAIRTDIQIDDMVDTIFITLRGVCFTWCVYEGNFNLEDKMVVEMQRLWEGISERQTPAPVCHPEY